MKPQIALLTVLSAMLIAPASAQNSAVGLWKNVEGEKVTLIRTYEEGGKLAGKVGRLETLSVTCRLVGAVEENHGVNGF